MRNFNVGYIKSDYKFKKDIRLTLDFEEDLEQLNKFIQIFNKEHNFRGGNKIFE